MKSISFEKAIEIALEQHRAGNFSRAEALYMEILRQDPGNVDAIHLLGVLATQGKRPDVAVDLISAAIRKKPDTPIFHYNLAEALHLLGQKEEALAAYRRAVELAPDYFEAHNNLANLLNEMGRYDEAEGECRRAIEIDPEAAAPWNNLGNSLRGLRRGEEALVAYRTAIQKRPDFAEAINNLAMCLCWLNQLQEGIQQFKAAIALSPASADLHNNLGTALTYLGRYEEAGQSFQTAIDLKPDHAEAHNNLGSTLRTLGKPAEAVALFKKAVELKSGFAEAYSNMASALVDLHKTEEALDAANEALKLKPRSVKDHYQRANILRELFRVDEGIDAVRDALRLEPDNVASLMALGYALLERGDLDEAMSALKRSIELKPDPQTHSNVLMTINYHPGYSPADLMTAHQSWAELHEKPHTINWKPHANDRSPERRLRIGYVSPDFRGHSVSYFLEPIIEHHDRTLVEVYGYAHLITPDLHTWRLRAQIDQWREISARKPGDVAEQIRTDQIDILVELAGHTGNNALPVFARKPAPIQINMIGFPSTTGLTAMDYRITDALCDPPGVTDSFNTEKLIRIPGVFWCYQPPHNSPEIGPLPAETSGTVTFASVNNFTKVTPDVQQMWSRILMAVPKSRLIFQTSAMASRHTREKVTKVFTDAGVSSDRLEFREWSDFSTYLKLLERSDITLDPFPFNGGTTTCHSLWMGAPVITLAGDRHASRMGLSMMTAIGLPEFVAYTPDEYVQIAVRFANDLARLREIRVGMRDRLKASPLLDGAAYTRNLEAAYREVWHAWCASGT
jgi:predicted O-linked N-acetylglucosamine transferase (SPINDLY family)